MNKIFTISLKAARVNAGFTLEEAAEAVLRNKNTISNWETGRHAISKSDFSNLCELYNTPEEIVRKPEAEKGNE